jgi:hypothetical protein
VEEAVEVVLFYQVLMVEAVVVVVRGHSVEAVVEEVLTH